MKWHLFTISGLAPVKGCSEGGHEPSASVRGGEFLNELVCHTLRIAFDRLSDGLSEGTAPVMKFPQGK